MKNKIKVGVLVGIIALAVIGYMLTQGSAFARTNSTLQKAEKNIIKGSLTSEKALGLRNDFLVYSQKAKDEAKEETYELQDLSALLQAHLTTLDVLDNSVFVEENILIRDAVIGRIVEIESELIGQYDAVVDVEKSISDLAKEINVTVEEFKSAQGNIPSRMFDEVQVAIQQASIALGESQAALLQDMNTEASRSALRARKFIIEAQYTIELAKLMQKYDYTVTENVQQ